MTTALTVQEDNKNKILALQEEVAKLPQVEFPLAHNFTDGVYVRTMFIPAGTVIVGKTHKHECISLVSKGRITIFTEDGLKEVQAPYMANAPAGVKRVGWAHEDTIWTTIHKNEDNETDLDLLEDRYTINDTLDVQEFLEEYKQKQLELA